MYTRSLENVSLNLRAALEDLEELCDALSTETVPATADNSSQLAAMATKFFKGMRSVHVVCNTGQHMPSQHCTAPLCLCHSVAAA